MMKRLPLLTNDEIEVIYYALSHYKQWVPKDNFMQGDISKLIEIVEKKRRN